MTNPFLSFEITLRNSGFEPEVIYADRSLRRCYVRGDRGGTKNGWYVLNNDADRFWGIFGSHKTGERYTWNCRDVTGISANKPLAQPIPRRACPIATIWGNAVAPDPKHAYLIAKRVSGKGLRQSGRQLLVPYRDIDGKLTALGTIKPNGTKLLLPGSKPRGAFMTLGKIGGRLLICEGYATAAACHAATDVTTIVAGSAENLAPAAFVIRERYPAVEIVFMADDDHECDVNKGLKAANDAAATVGGIVVTPSEFYFVRDKND